MKLRIGVGGMALSIVRLGGVGGGSPRMEIVMKLATRRSPAQGMSENAKKRGRERRTNLLRAVDEPIGPLFGEVLVSEPVLRVNLSYPFISVIE